MTDSDTDRQDVGETLGGEGDDLAAKEQRDRGAKAVSGTKGEEFEIRRYEARWSLYKILAGSTGVAIIAAIFGFYIDMLDANRQETNEHRSFVDSYIDSALNQDIELRIRFAEYFSYLADEDTKAHWELYYNHIVENRSRIRKEINANEERRANLIAAADGELSEEAQIEVARLERELSWLYGEVGYAQENVSIVQNRPDSRGRLIYPKLDAGYIEESQLFLRENDVKNVRAEELLVMGKANQESRACGGLNAAPPRDLWPNIVGAAEVLDEIREETDAHVEVISAFRTPEYNSCLGGAASSVQLQFLGFDISSTDWSSEELANYVRQLRDQGVFEGGVGEYPTFVHVDARGARADWKG